MHSEVTASDTDSMNATYNGRVSIITSYIKPSVMIMDELIPIVTEGNGLYEVSHEDATITYTSDIEAQENLKQTEYRYAGSNPNNYVKFNNELWRIIGLVNTPEGSRVKIIRDESIGEYSWDTSASSINSGWGVNEWTTSKIKLLLNEGAYYNRTSGTCYIGVNNGTTICDFSENGLLEESKNMIDTITWNIGSNDGVSYGDENINTKIFYDLERSNNTGKICSSGGHCNDNKVRTSKWLGEIGLMYPSDYGYATSGGSGENRNTCLNTILYAWDKNEFCYQNDWLYDEFKFQWTITPRAAPQSTRGVFTYLNNGTITDYGTFNPHIIRPSLYLKSNIKIGYGNGTKENPYELVNF